MKLIAQKYQLGAKVLAPGLVQSGINCIIGLVCLVPAANEHGYNFGYGIMTNTTGKWVPIDMPNLLNEEQLQPAPLTQVQPEIATKPITEPWLEPAIETEAPPPPGTTQNATEGTEADVIALHELRVMPLEDVAILLAKGIITKEQAEAATGKKVETIGGIDYLQPYLQPEGESTHSQPQER